MEFLRSFFRRHFAGKPVVAWRNVRGFFLVQCEASVTATATATKILVIRWFLACNYSRLLSLNPPWSQWGIRYFGFSQTWILMHAFLSIGWFSLTTESESEPGTFRSSENSVLIALTTPSLTIKWKSQAEAEELNQSQCVGMSIVIGFSFPSRFRLRQSGFHYFVRIGSYLNAILRLINNKLL